MAASSIRCLNIEYEFVSHLLAHEFNDAFPLSSQLFFPHLRTRS